MLDSLEINSYETYHQVKIFFRHWKVNTDWHIRSRLKSPDYIFSKDQVLFPKVFGIHLYLKRSLMSFIEGYILLWKVMCSLLRSGALYVGQMLLLKVIYSSDIKGQVIFIEGHVNYKQVNQTPLKVRFSFFWRSHAIYNR